MRATFAVAVLLVAACTDDSGTARRVSTGTESAPPRRPAPEPPGGPPTCAEVGRHLGSQLGPSRPIETEVGGRTMVISGEEMREGIVEGVAGACRTAAWTHETRVCALGWRGNFLRDRASLRAACPGTAR